MTLSHNFPAVLKTLQYKKHCSVCWIYVQIHSKDRFPYGSCKLKGLCFLDMSNNLFNGSIPPCLKNPMVPLIDLSLRNNNFNGVLPDIFANATKLRSLDVSYNQLEGDFPKSFMNCKALQLVNVESNKLKDKFPLWLGSLPSLHVLILRSNEFYGPLYHNHMSIGFQSLRVIDVSHNDFSGTLPPNYFFSRREMTTLPEENDYMIDFVNATSLGKLIIASNPVWFIISPALF